MSIFDKDLSQLFTDFKKAVENNDGLLIMENAIAIFDNVITNNLEKDLSLLDMMKSVYQDSFDVFKRVRWTAGETFENNLSKADELSQNILGPKTSQKEIYMLTGDLNLFYERDEIANLRFNEALKLANSILKDMENDITIKDGETINLRQRICECWAKIALTSKDNNEKDSYFRKTIKVLDDLDNNTYDYDTAIKMEAYFPLIKIAYFQYSDEKLTSDLIDTLFDDLYSWSELELGDMYRYAIFSSIYYQLGILDLKTNESVELLLTLINCMIESHKRLGGETILGYIKSCLTLINKIKDPYENVNKQYFDDTIRNGQEYLKTATQKVTA